MTQVWALVSANYTLTNRIGETSYDTTPYRLTQSKGEFSVTQTDFRSNLEVPEERWLAAAYRKVIHDGKESSVLVTEYFMSLAGVTVAGSNTVKSIFSSDEVWKWPETLTQKADDKINNGTAYAIELSKLYDVDNLRTFTYTDMGQRRSESFYGTTKFLVPVEVFTYNSDRVDFEKLVPVHGSLIAKELGGGSDTVWLPTSKQQYERWRFDTDVLSLGVDNDTVNGKDVAGSVAVTTGYGLDKIYTGKYDDFVNVARGTHVSGWAYGKTPVINEYDFGGWKHFGRLPPIFQYEEKAAAGIEGDKVIYTYGGNDVAFGGNGIDRMFGGDGDDMVFGSDGGDYLYGGNHHDYLNGGTGGDELRGEDGNDYLYSGIDDEVDKLYGGAGDDIINSAVRDGADKKGTDWKNGNILDGGSGKDYFFASNGDHVRDLERGETVRFVIKDKKIENVLGISDDSGVRFNFFEKDNPAVAARLFIDNRIHPSELAISHNYFDGYSDKTEMHFVITRSSVARVAGTDPMEDLVSDVLGAITKNIIKQGASMLLGDLVKASLGKFEIALAATTSARQAKEMTEILSGTLADSLVTAAFNRQKKLTDPKEKDPILSMTDVISSMSGQMVQIMIESTPHAKAGKVALILGEALIEGFFEGLETRLESKVWRALDDAPDEIEYKINLPSGGTAYVIDNAKTLATFKGSATKTDTIMTKLDVTTPGKYVDNIIVSSGTPGKSATKSLLPLTAVTKIANGNALDNQITVSGAVLKSNGMAGDDELKGGEYHDILDGGAGNDTLYAGEGGATMTGGAGSDTLRGGTGIDIAAYDLETGKKGIRADLETGRIVDTFGNTDTVSAIEIVRGTAYADTFKGGWGRDTFTGGAGKDVFDGGNGGDTVDYGAEKGKKGVVVNLATGVATDSFGHKDTLVSIENVLGTRYNDTLTSGAGHDLLRGGAGNDILAGGAGSDVLAGGDGADILNGGDGWDTISFEDVVTKGVTFALTKSGSGSFKDTSGAIDKYTSIECIRGSQVADKLTGNGVDNYLEGMGGKDTLDGGAGSDTARYNREDRFGGTAGIKADLVKGTVKDTFGDTDTLKNIENIQASVFNDTVMGNNSANILSGDNGNDTLKGAGGSDTLYGGYGFDTLDGGKGNDRLDGGEDFDIFMFRQGDGKDTIVNFDPQYDIVRLVGVKPNTLKLSTVDGNTLVTYGTKGDTILFESAKYIITEYAFDFV